MTYGFSKTLSQDFDAALESVKEQLQEEGFGVLTQIPIHEKLKEKLGVDFHNYVILGACNPPSAHKALLAEENIGLMLPCNVILYEKEGKTILSVIKPTVAMSMIENPDLKGIADKIESKLQRVFDRVA
ncbi:DUF302 domain-containing protein [candidate division KSB3 bacterium]|uniref:DUF302 domain-containing protein n=1 Tax=candidate division KSB3 bacterium TaxID=2044937 RepID=A0A9D5JTR7_9BACT|nr:DUF302 domain-containing protein [candidate division KSB3 bacterium]MBD3324062.1 DUF302 domain-containing protein [candidate division KSB3 bacterium]